MNFFQTEDIPKTEQTKRPKLVPARSLSEFCLGKALMKSKHVELMISFYTEDIPKTEQIKRPKLVPGRSHLEFHLGNALMKSK